MARPDKAAGVAELVESFQDSAGAVLTEYRGLTVKQLQELRRALGENANYAVVKNTLTQIAATQAGVDGFDDLLTGPTAIAFINGDVVEAAKGLRDFARAHPALVIKGGVLEGRTLDPAEIARLADLESREVLLARLAGGMLASLSQAVYLLNAPLAQAARLAGALQAKAEEDPSVLRGGAGTPAPAEAGSDTAEAGSDTVEAGSDTVEAGSDTADAGSDTVEAGSDTAEAAADTAEAGSAEAAADETAGDSSSTETDSVTSETGSTEAGSETSEADSTEAGSETSETSTTEA